jgi:glucosyl-3-phosphoglycerate phosphatase
MILLLRHGETDWNVEPARCQGWADVGLNETGRARSRDQGRAVRGRGLERIVSSHLIRARETAEIVRAELAAAREDAAAQPKAGLPLVVDPRLAETRRGAWQGRLFGEIIAAEPDAWRHYREDPTTFRFPGGESLVEQLVRVLACLRDVALDGRRNLLVTHGGSIRLIRCFLDGRGVAAFHEGTTGYDGVNEVPTDGLVQRIDAFLLGNA